MTTGDGGASRVVQVTRISVGSEVNAKRVYRGGLGLLKWWRQQMRREQQSTACEAQGGNQIGWTSS